MNMNGTDKFIRACSLTELKEKGRILFTADSGGEAAILFVKGKIYAVDNVCPHNHTPKMHLGIVSGSDILCPVHMYKFSLITGKHSENQVNPLRTYKVKIEDDDVFIEKPQTTSFNFDF
ncbi:MAG: Rieske (2Fe-2S) protein [Bacteroidetes bacterium]|nr:Rieske (2Fe-2S) protein [Bacteroidota bacterium]